MSLHRTIVVAALVQACAGFQSPGSFLAPRALAVSSFAKSPALRPGSARSGASSLSMAGVGEGWICQHEEPLHAPNTVDAHCCLLQTVESAFHVLEQQKSPCPLPVQKGKGNEAAISVRRCKWPQNTDQHPLWQRGRCSGRATARPSPRRVTS